MLLLGRLWRRQQGLSELERAKREFAVRLLIIEYLAPGGRLSDADFWRRMEELRES